MNLPEALPRGVEVFDVEGIPVSLGNVPDCPFSSAAWDKGEPRVFDPVSARRNGAPISWDAFRALVSEARNRGPGSPEERRRMQAEFDKLIETSFLPSLNRAARESANNPPPSRTIKDDAEPDDKKG